MQTMQISCSNSIFLWGVLNTIGSRRFAFQEGWDFVHNKQRRGSVVDSAKLSWTNWPDSGSLRWVGELRWHKLSSLVDLSVTEEELWKTFSKWSLERTIINYTLSSFASIERVFADSSDHCALNTPRHHKTQWSDAMPTWLINISEVSSFIFHKIHNVYESPASSPKKLWTFPNLFVTFPKFIVRREFTRKWRLPKHSKSIVGWNI